MIQKLILSSSKFDKILGDVQVVSDYLTIHTSDSKADFSGKGDSGEVTIDIEKEMKILKKFHLKKIVLEHTV